MGHFDSGDGGGCGGVVVVVVVLLLLLLLKLVFQAEDTSVSRCHQRRQGPQVSG